MMHKILDYLTKVIGWLQIVASPLLFGLGIGAIIFFPNPTTTRLIIGISIATLGLVMGIFLATKIWKTKEGTIGFMSKILATPELDKNDSDRKEESH
ncbi:MAG: hypothetical protein IPQ19_16835 [Bacteroidetes bacterium]|nr:hypothetical protein [Bacteroidota bacterium]